MMRLIIRLLQLIGKVMVIVTLLVIFVMNAMKL